MEGVKQEAHMKIVVSVMFCHFRGITILGTVCMYRLGAVESSSAIQSALINMYVHGLDYTTIMENII